MNFKHHVRNFSKPPMRFFLPVDISSGEHNEMHFTINSTYGKRFKNTVPEIPGRKNKSSGRTDIDRKASRPNHS
jgi:hypothetical protein